MAGHGPNPIDVAVGQRVRALRIQRGLNQSQLAKALGLTFQQVQKYEKGTNRISCSKLVGIASTLSVAPAFFFEGIAFGALPETSGPAIPPRLLRALSVLSPARVSALTDVAIVLAGEGE